ncbi:MAG: hypothetical protein A2428_08595 [Bdellovibrionales bacterium RIFOXYC1_FULL_54_43]|nr:MAG: hypothetical protein A2428_08595 [Bdellovibrionales bacterium RIFOXYC1_FULL_54_43]OFZ84276.1 MAG: hypothetical protein A2603_15175 [Bdellovibrionales bacterium RIFOXYD1_FULL_55_31]
MISALIKTHTWNFQTAVRREVTKPQVGLLGAASTIVALLFSLTATAQAFTPSNSAVHYFDDTGTPLPQYEPIYQKLEAIYPGSVPEKIVIVFTDDTASRFDTKHNRILLSRKHFAQIPTYLIAHESSHLCLFRLTRGASIQERFRFFDEGYASIVGHRIAGNIDSYKHNESLPTAAVQHMSGNVNFVKVQDWKSYFGGSYNANFYAYPVGASFDFFLIDTYGQQALDQFFLSIGSTQDLESTFQALFHKSASEIERAWLSYLATVAIPDAPSVVSMSPANNAVNVSPDLSEIAVNFSTEMQEKVVFISNRCDEICYTGAYWKNNHTLAVRVRGALKPNTQYSLSLGSDKHGHFVSRAGLTLPVTEWRFTTGDRSL